MSFTLKSMALAVAAAGLCAGLSGCVIVDADVRESDWDRASGAEILLGAEVGVRAPEVSIVASSNGCTRKEHFTPDIDSKDDGRRFDVRFRRTVEDHCKALMPEGVRMTWSFAELGLPQGAEIRITNRIGR